MTLYERALRVTPSGSQTLSKAPGRVGPIGAFPLIALEGHGATLLAEDDSGVRREYIDWFNGNCAVTLGHGHQEVTAAVEAAIAGGALLSLPARAEVQTAEALLQRLTWAEQVRFTKTGSEACAGAVRMARMATGRDVILTVPGGYHGWHDWFAVLKPEHPGVPDVYGTVVDTFTFNDLASLEAGFARHPGRVAAVMLEPAHLESPASGVLDALAARARAAGALVIFDEMICGNRWAVGGAGALYDVVPDLAVFGKAFANGFPLAFIVGRRDVMQHAWVVSGTFGGDTAALAACRAVLEVYTRDRVIDAIWRAGTAVRQVFIEHVTRLGLPARVVGPPCRFALRWQGPPDQVALLTGLFQEALAVEGVLAHPSGWNPSLAHSEDIVRQTSRGVRRALEAVADRVRRGQLALVGQPMQSGIVRAL